jgi:hypothetical protein
MKLIAQRFWKEPAVAIGALWSLGLLILAIITSSFDAGAIVGIVSPILSALGIRQVVTPSMSKPEAQPAIEAAAPKPPPPPPVPKRPRGA